MLLVTAPLVNVGERSLGSDSAARAYAATRTNVEATPVTPAGGPMPTQRRGGRGQQHLPSRRPPDADPHKGKNVDMEV